MAAAAILDCRICKISLADAVWKAQMHHCTKFRQNGRSIAEIEIFPTFKNGCRRHFGFLK